MKIKFVERMSERINEAGYDRKLVQLLMRLILRSQSGGDMTLVNEVMKRIDTNRAHYGVISGMLRASLRTYHYMDEWLPLRDRLIESIKDSKEINYRSLLVGMLNMEGYKPPTELDRFLRVHSNFREQHADKIQIP